ncbi:DNA-binding transcriptional LysR family regulator [Bradyrhizobium yuanmingense]|uniref:LysR family substrate-binding domain-containing protein n=1 Tax=Bradyrhizobium yuanmingense TaxID=108015 RepID=UPI0035157EBC
MEEVDALIATARAVRHSEVGRLAIGFCTSISAGNLQACMLEFKQRLPHLELAPVERSRARLATALHNGLLDVLIVTGNMPLLDNKTMALWSERVLVVLPHDHPLSSRETVYWTELRRETVLLSQCDSGKQLEDLLACKLVSPEHRPSIERHDVSPGVIKSLIQMGAGISLVLESDTGTNFAGLIYRELRDGTGPSRFDFSAYWRADNENPALAAFLKMLRDRYHSPSLAG